MAYTRQEIIDIISDKAGNPNKLYKSDVVNYKGKTEDTGMPYVEVCSEYLLREKFINKEIQIPTERRDGYFIKSHNGVIKEFTNRGEEILAKAVYLEDIPKLGMVFDYQIPLKGRATDEGVGKIDMVSINEEGIISLIELKAAKSNETLLRCALEIYTYSKQINKEIFINDIKNSYINKFKENELLNRFEKFNNKFKNVVLIFGKSTPAKMVNNNEYPMTNELVRELGVKVYVYPADIEFKASAKFKAPLPL